MSEPHIDRSAEVRLTVYLCVCLSMCPSVRVEHNGHARRKEHMVELYCFVVHAQCNDKHEGEKIGEGIPEVNDAHVAGLNVIENQQDREGSGMESSRRKRTACTYRLEGNRVSEREKITAGR